MRPGGDPAQLHVSEDPQQRTKAIVSGTVLDPSGSAIVGARVVLTQSGGRPSAETTTDATGAFRVEGIKAGTYVLDVQANGFQEARRDVAIGEKAAPPLRIVLAIATEKQVVTVSADQAAPVVSTEISDNLNANTIDRSALDRLPVFDQDYIATLSRFLDDNAIGTNGITLVVNGVEANGPGVTSSAIQEVKINQNPYSALFSRPGRARLEIITKGGTDDLHGTVNFMFRDAFFDASNKFATSKPAERRQFYEGSLSGPLTRSGKTTFLLSLDQDMDDQQAIVHASGVNGAIDENLSAPMHHFFGSGRIFHDLANGDQFWIGYSYERQTNKNQNVGGTVLPEAGYNSTNQEHEINVSYRHLFSPRLVNQLRFLIGHFDRPITSVQEKAQVVVSGAVTQGGAQADGRRTEYHFDGTDVVSYSTGKQTLNFGIDVPDISRRGEDDFTNRAGTYTYGSLADYPDNPSTYLVQAGQGHLVFLEKVLSGFVEDTVRLKPNFSVSVGLRYYWQNYFHDDPNNFAPRFGFAFAPSKNSKTVIRGGAGMFYDRSGPRPIADLLHFDGVHLLRFIVDKPFCPNCPKTPPDLAGTPTSVVTLDPRARIPYTIQYSAGLERQITAKSTLSATYIESRGIHSFRSIDANAPLSPTMSRPNPGLGQERQIQSEGYQKSKALEVTFRGSPVKFLTGQVQYTFSKTYNNTSGITFFPANSYDPSADWGRSDNDRRHKLDLLGSAQAGRLFVFGVALSLYSGKPVNVTTGSDDNHDGITNDRPGGVSRNTLPGPGLINLDLSVAHDFLLSKSPEHAKKFTVSLNSFNVLNHPNDVTYVGVITSPFFRQAVQAQPPRRFQFDAQFKF
jgi:hypothetical protein